MDRWARGSGWALGLQGWCRAASLGRVAGARGGLGLSGEGGRPGIKADQGCCQTLTSFAVSSHDGVRAIEPDAADD